MLKLSTPKAAAPAEKPIVITDEMLLDSLHACSMLDMALSESCADANEVATVLDNLEMCARAIKNGGLTKQVVAALNSRGELSECCGQENLTIAGLESLETAAVKELSDKYNAALEGKFAEFWAKFIAILKNISTQIVTYFKTAIQNRARFVNKLESFPDITKIETKTGSEIIDETFIQSVEDIKNEIDIGKKMQAAINSFLAHINDNDEIPSDFDKFTNEAAAAIEAERKKADLESLNITLPKLKTIKEEYIAYAKDLNFNKVPNTLSIELNRLVAEAGKASKLEGEEAVAAKEKIMKQRVAVNAAIEMCRKEYSLCIHAGNELVKWCKYAADINNLVHHADAKKSGDAK